MTNPPRKNVLVVEDDPSVRRLIVRHLASLSVDVTDVADARSAMSKLSTQAPDLLVLDLMLPDSSGYALCQEMKQHPKLKDVPVLVVTARSSVSDRAEAEELGITEYLTKPFHRTDFLKMAKGLLNLTG
jgi:two-component system, OmpR family, response regulator